MANWLQLIGLALDLIGVYLMAKDLIRVDKTVGTWAQFDKAQEKHEHTRSLTVRGPIFIAFGFTLQAAGTIINIYNTP